MVKVKQPAAPAEQAEAGPSSKKKQKKTATAAADTPVGKPKTDKQLYTELVQGEIEKLKGQGKITTDTATWDRWVEIMAQGLVRNPKYLEIMQNAPDQALIILSNLWCAAIDLPERWRHYEKYDTWNGQFFKASRYNGKEKVLNRASEIYFACIGTEQLRIEKTKISPPEASPEADQQRVEIFRHHSARANMREAIKQCDDLEYVQAKKLTNAALASTSEAVIAQRKVILEEIRAIQKIKKALRDKLNSSPVYEAAKKQIKALLREVPSPVGIKLYEVMSAQATGPTATAAEPPKGKVARRNNVDLDPDELQAMLDKIEQAHPGQAPNFIGHYSNTTTGAISLRAPGSTKKGNKALDPATVPEIDKVDAATYDAIEGNLADFVKKCLESVDSNRFKANMKAFEAISARPPEAAAALETASALAFRPGSSILLLKDNIYHVRALLNQLVVRQLLRRRSDGTPDLSAVQRIMRRMLALISLQFGCVAEGSLLLTSMDALLEELAQHVVGHKDHAYDTTAIQRLPHILVQGDQITDMPKTTKDDVQTLEDAEIGRIIFAELARFYRGAVMMAYACVSWTAGEQDKTWFEGLLKWCTHCGLETCKQQLLVDYDPERKKQMYNLSVAVKDPRAGFPAERTEISTNRTEAYSCLAELTQRVQYHPGFGPFFHYFAHLYHATCKAHRGKEKIMHAIARSTPSSSQQQPVS